VNKYLDMQFYQDGHIVDIDKDLRNVEFDQIKLRVKEHNRGEEQTVIAIDDDDLMDKLSKIARGTYLGDGYKTEIVNITSAQYMEEWHEEE